MLSKLLYWILRMINKRRALDYAIKRQIISTKIKGSMEWYYWYEKIKDE